LKSQIQIKKESSLKKTTKTGMVVCFKEKFFILFYSRMCLIIKIIMLIVFAYTPPPAHSAVGGAGIGITIK